MNLATEVHKAVRRVECRVKGRVLRHLGRTGIQKAVEVLPIVPGYPFDPELKILRSLGIGSAMFDIGANTGIYSSALLDLVGASNLYLFEPLSKLCRQLARKFPKSHVFNTALSNRVGEERIRIPYIHGRRYDTRATLNAHEEHGQTGYEEVRVRLDTLDETVKMLGLTSMGFAKVDVEGHELEVLEGGRSTLAQLKPLVLIEVEARHHNASVDDVFSAFAELKYRGYYVDPSSLTLHSVAEFDLRRDQDLQRLETRDFFRYLNNFFFIHHTQEPRFYRDVRACLDRERRASMLF